MTNHPHPPETSTPTHAHDHPIPIHEHNHSPSPKQKNPSWILIAGIVLVLILAVGILLFTRLQGNQTDNLPPAVPLVEVKLLVDQNCLYCFQSNTILAKFDQSNIKYRVETYDVQSEEGKKLATEFEIDYVPTALVNLKGLDQNSEIQRALQGQLIKDPLPIKKGWVVVQEKFLDKRPHLLTFLNPPEACTIPPGKILVNAQLDYGDCKPCTEAHYGLEKLKEKYSSLQVQYTPILYNRTTLKSLYAAVQANKGAVCAEQLGYLNEYTSCNYFYTQFQGTLDINYMKSCAREAGMSVTTVREEFEPCVLDQNGSAEPVLVQNSETMHEWNPLKYTPSFVIDCKYSFVGFNSLESYMCSFHSELENCPALNVDENALAPGDIPDENDSTKITQSTDANGTKYIQIGG